MMWYFLIGLVFCACYTWNLQDKWEDTDEWKRTIIMEVVLWLVVWPLIMFVEAVSWIRKRTQA